MHRFAPFLALAAVALTGCSSTGVYNLQKRGAPVSVAPRVIFVSPFTVRTDALQLGERTRAEKAALGREISAALARRTASEVRRYAAPASVLAAGRNPGAGTWQVRGEILKVDQGSRALRAGVGLGAGRTEFRTRVTVSEISRDGSRTILTFRTTGVSGLEPGAALGVVGGAGAAQVAGGALLGSMSGVGTDIDRTAHEIAAVLSAYLSRNGLLSRSRPALTPNMAGQLPSTMNTRRVIPAPVRDVISP
jgi:hypothetical protein